MEGTRDSSLVSGPISDLKASWQVTFQEYELDIADGLFRLPKNHL